MIKIYFDEELIDTDSYTSIENSYQVLGDSFVLGTTSSNSYEISILKTAITNLSPNYVYIYDDDNLIATLTIDSYTIDKDVYNFQLIDRMVDFEYYYNAQEIFHNIGEGVYSEGYATLLEIVQDICNRVNIELATTDFRGYDKNISWYDSSITAREYLAMVAELNSGYAIIGIDGKLYFKKYTQTPDLTINVDDVDMFRIGDKKQITRVVYDNGFQIYEFGEDSKTTIYLDVNNVFITEESEVESIYNDLKDFYFYNIETGNCPIDHSVLAGATINFVDGDNVYPTICNYEGLQYFKEWFGNYSLDVASDRQDETKTIGIESQIKSIKTEIDRDLAEMRIKITETSEITDAVSSTGFKFSIEGLKIENTDYKTYSLLNQLGLSIKDNTGEEQENLLFAGYNEETGQTEVDAKNLTIDHYMIIDKTRFEKYVTNEGEFTALFYLE